MGAAIVSVHPNGPLHEFEKEWHYVIVWGHNGGTACAADTACSAPDNPRLAGALVVVSGVQYVQQVLLQSRWGP